MLYVMCGCPGSGKTTYAANLLMKIPHTVYISRDACRFLLLQEKEDYFSREKEVFASFLAQICDNLQAGFNVIADATHLNVKSRNKLISGIAQKVKDFEVTYICLETPLATCLKRNEKRSGTAHVPEEALKNMYNRYHRPTLEEHKQIKQIVVIKEENQNE